MVIERKLAVREIDVVSEGVGERDIKLRLPIITNQRLNKLSAKHVSAINTN